MATYTDEESGLPFRIIEAGEVDVAPPTGTVFVCFAPIGVSATGKAEASPVLTERGSHSFATSGIYGNAPKEFFKLIRGRYVKISCTVGSIMAWYK